jgi:hypothetical protein
MMRRLIAVSGIVALGLGVGAGTATAQEPVPAPPVTNCYPLLSSLVCTIPVNVGPFNITVPIESVFPPSNPS